MRRGFSGGNQFLVQDDYKGDDDDDKAVAIPSHQGEEIQIRKHLRFIVYGVVLWQPSVLSPRPGTLHSFLERLHHIAECASEKVYHVKFSEQVCTEILFLERGIRDRIGTMRASYLSSNRENVQATKERPRFVSETNEAARNMLRCLVRYLVDRGRLVQVMLEPDEEVSSTPNQTRTIQESVGRSEQMQVFSGQRDVTVSCVDTGSNHAERVLLTRKKTMRIHESLAHDLA